MVWYDFIAAIQTITATLCSRFLYKFLNLRPGYFCGALDHDVTRLPGNLPPNHKKQHPETLV